MDTIILVISLILLGLIILSVLFCFIICETERKRIFPNRFDRTEETLQDRPLSDFNGLKNEDFYFSVKKTALKGRFYYYDNKDTNPIIIFCHGLGAGHEAYITEIDYYAKNGYTCISFDYRGCKLSDGKSSHFGASITDLKALYNHLESINFLQEKPLYLWGHSWGAYTALAGGSKLDKVKKIVAFCPFDTPVNLITNQAFFYIKKFAYFLKPFRIVYYNLKYKNANLSAYKSINNSNKKALIFFGENDRLIGKINFEFNKNAEVITCKNKGHNPYSSVNAQNYLQEVFTNLNNAENKKKFLSTVDYKLITEQDISVLNKTLEFLK